MDRNRSAPRIVLSGMGPRLQGQQWESSQRLRIGRQPNLEIVLEDPLISRQHAEVVVGVKGWSVRDLGSRGRTFLNGIVVDHSPRKIRLQDVLHCGQHAFRVTLLQEGDKEGPSLPLPEKLNIETTNFVAKVESATQRSWEQGLQALAQDSPHLPHSKHFFTLVRAGYHLCRIDSLPELLQSILDDTVAVFDAERGAVLLQDETTGKFEVRGSSPRSDYDQEYSRTLTEHCFRKGESFLCSGTPPPDAPAAPELASERSGSMVCALLRSPRKRLGVLHLDRGPDRVPFTREDLQLADALAASISVGIECAQILEMNRRPTLSRTTEFVRQTIAMRDKHCGQHVQRVEVYATWLGEELTLTSQQRQHLQMGALLHDVGKIAVQDAVLRKPDKLTPEEIADVRESTLKGAVLAGILPDLDVVLPIIRHHGERWDGTGYPDGLAAERIPLLARIVAVADAYDAMTTEQPYRPARSIDEALAELTAGAGTQFDPHLVEVFLRLRPRLEEPRT